MNNALPNIGFWGYLFIGISLCYSILISYKVYRYKRSLPLFVVLSTVSAFLMVYVFLCICDQYRVAINYAVLGATLSFLSSLLYAGYSVFFQKHDKVQNISSPQHAKQQISSYQNTFEQPNPPTRNVAYRTLLILLYLCILLLILLFPPYREITGSGYLWKFITAKNMFAHYSFDYSFFAYELLILTLVICEIEFYWKQYME